MLYLIGLSASEIKREHIILSASEIKREHIIKSYEGFSLLFGEDVFYSSHLLIKDKSQQERISCKQLVQRSDIKFRVQLKW